MLSVCLRDRLETVSERRVGERYIGSSGSLEEDLLIALPVNLPVEAAVRPGFVRSLVSAGKSNAQTVGRKDGPTRSGGEQRRLALGCALAGEVG